MSNLSFFGSTSLYNISADKAAIRAKESSKQLLEKAVRELDKIVLEDGSIKNRTTRGNKGLWYHHTGLIETMVTLETRRR